jgi:hypothetical protein
MSAEGMFHDAHEVYAIDATGERSWHATFATKSLAENYVSNESAWDDVPGTVGFGRKFEVERV